MRLSTSWCLSVAVILMLVVTRGHGNQLHHDHVPRHARQSGGGELLTPRASAKNSSTRQSSEKGACPVKGKVPDLDNCYEHEDTLAPVILRESWNSEAILERLSTPVEVVVIKDGGSNCNCVADCLDQMRLMNKVKPRTNRCGLRENFYVGGDGQVYEGRGWDFASYWYLNGLRKKSITVQFLGSYKRTHPSPEAFEAFEAAMEIGMWLGKLSQNFRITSFKQLHRERNVQNDALSKNPTESDRWLTGEELSIMWEYTIPRRLIFVFRKQWNALKPAKEFAAICRPVQYVVVREGVDRCFNRSDCISKMRAIQAEHIGIYGDLLDNFYIGDEGEVYEGRGWNYVPLWFVKTLEKSKYISVSLLGSYENNSRTPQVINSLKLLVQTGVSLGILSPDVRMLSLRQIYNQSVLFGDTLQDITRKWSVWSDLDLLNSASEPSVPKSFMSLQEWNQKPLSSSFSNNSQPINYVMIRDGGTRCASVELCFTRMRLEQNLTGNQNGDLMENFYIGDDGVVYEGRGWDVIPFLNMPFFNDSLISVKFLGSFQSSDPSRPAWLAFLALIDSGVVSEKISPDYRLYSFRHIYNDSSMLGDEITRVFEGIVAWDGKLSLESEDDIASSGTLPMYELDLSAVPAAHQEYPPLNIPVDYVVVGDSGQQCFTHEDCRENLVQMQIGDTQDFGNLPYNFYVGEDGSVFAGRGWNSTCYWHVSGVRADTVFVSFLGNFRNSLPNSYGFSAFNRLLQYGVGTGKLSSGHKTISVSQLYPNSLHAGEMLTVKIKSGDRWSEYQALSPGGVTIPFGPSALLSRKQWCCDEIRGQKEWCCQDSQTIELLNYPVPYVIILNAGDSCANKNDCIISVIAEHRRTHLRYHHSMENFYIGEDGYIYEGQGWHKTTHWHWKILNIDYVTVAFLGKFQNEPPSSKAITAFEYFLKSSIMKGKLQSNYSIFSLRQFLPEQTNPGDELDKCIRSWDNWSNLTSVAFVTNDFEILSPAMWGRSREIRRSLKIIHPLKYVYVRDGGRPCTSREECISRIKEIEKGKDGISENFYIGGLGKVFTGVGWEYDAKWGYEEWKYSISVQFLGNYESFIPTKDVLEAFTALCRYGVRKGYIDTNYKILFIPDGVDSRKWIGFKLKQLVKSWKRWVPNVYNMK